MSNAVSTRSTSVGASTRRSGSTANGRQAATTTNKGTPTKGHRKTARQAIDVAIQMAGTTGSERTTLAPAATPTATAAAARAAGRDSCQAGAATCPAGLASAKLNFD